MLAIEEMNLAGVDCLGLPQVQLVQGRAKAVVQEKNIQASLGHGHLRNLHDLQAQVEPHAVGSHLLKSCRNHRDWLRTACFPLCQAKLSSDTSCMMRHQVAVEQLHDTASRCADKQKTCRTDLDQRSTIGADRGRT